MIQIVSALLWDYIGLLIARDTILVGFYHGHHRIGIKNLSPITDQMVNSYSQA